MSEPEPPAEELRRLFAAERHASVADLAARAAVRAKLTASVGTAALGSTSTAVGGLFVAGKILAAVAILVGVGSLVSRNTDESVSAAQLEVATQETISIPETPVHARDVIVSLPPPAPSSRRQDPKTSVPAPVGEATLPIPETTLQVSADVTAPSETQAQLLRKAWGRMSAGDADGALQLAAQDERLHPVGALAEERDALEISALAGNNRVAEAKDAAARFLAEYPNSIHRALVLRAINRENE